MIDIKQLTDKDIGKEVFYTNGVGGKEFGRLKSWNDIWIFVVYKCDDEWDNYQDYTAAATNPKNLKWK